MDKNNKMNLDDLTVNYCNFCKKLILKKVYTIYRIIAVTDKDIYYFGMIPILEEIAKYTIQKMYHLSATELLLLRPDVIVEFFTEKFPNEKFEAWFFDDTQICPDCFFHGYTENVPLK